MSGQQMTETWHTKPRIESFLTSQQEVMHTCVCTTAERSQGPQLCTSKQSGWQEKQCVLSHLLHTTDIV